MQFFILAPSTELKEEELAFYKEAKVRNFIFFKQHFEVDFLEYLNKLKKELKELAFLCVDQEGGRVARIPGDYSSPLSMAKLRKEKGDKVFLEWATSLAKAVKNYGLNVNLAPCVDLASTEAPDFLKERTFSLDPEEVSECATLFYRAHKEQGIAVCLKHFPGLGGVEVDPHENLPKKRSLTDKDLLPYKKLSSLYPIVMTTHLIVEDFDNKPATFSQKIVYALRNHLEFKGIILTDDLNMKALKEFELAERFILSLASGHNFLVYCGDYSEIMKIWDDLRKEVEVSAVLREKAKESLNLLEKFKKCYQLQA